MANAAANRRGETRSRVFEDRQNYGFPNSSVRPLFCCRLTPFESVSVESISW
jgi:hypothetical protein